MYGIFPCIRLNFIYIYMFMVNAGKYTIHGCYGGDLPWSGQIIIFHQPRFP